MPAADWSGRLVLAAALAAGLAIADLALKAALPTAAAHFHERSQAWVAVSVVLLLTMLLLTLVRSRAVALGAGLLAGGVAGNLLSAGWNGGAVPNPLLLGGADGIAFNAADVFILAGNLLLVVSLSVVAIRHRHRLIPPREWEQALYRQARRARARGRSGPAGAPRARETRTGPRRPMR